MKKIATILSLIISIFTFAQVPQGISYQAIALNSSGNPVVSSNVGIRLSVLDNSVTGANLYTETQAKTTNAQGLFNLVIGQGAATSGTFNTINWGTNSKFLKVELDVTGGANYVLVGTTQLLSVPYALFAGSVIDNSSKTISFNNNSGNGTIILYSSSEARSFSTLNGWSSPYGFNGNIIGSVASNNNVVVYSNIEARSYNSSNGWSSAYPLNNTIKGGVASNTNIVIYSDSETRSYNNTNGWSSAYNLNGIIIGAVSSNSNIIVFSNSEARSYNTTNGWSSAYTFNGTVLGAIASGDNIVVYSTIEARSYTSSNGWSSAYPFNGTVIGGIGAN
jgi:hypothetical protein